MRLHRLNNPLIHPVFLKYFSAEFHVRSLNVVVNRLADVVKERALFGDFHAGAKFRGQHSRHVRHLNGVG